MLVSLSRIVTQAGARKAGFSFGERYSTRVHRDGNRQFLSSSSNQAQKLATVSRLTNAAIEAVTGLGPHQYLLQYRLVRARHLLAESTLSVKEIAAQTGFKDEHYFSRLFRRRSHLSPSQWRRRQFT